MFSAIVIEISNSFKHFAQTPGIEVSGELEVQYRKATYCLVKQTAQMLFDYFLEFPMAKFSIGEVVDQPKGHSGVIVAVFTTTDGELRYAVDHEGELQFPSETSLVLHKNPDPRHS
jgi:hypothetical protein